LLYIGKDYQDISIFVPKITPAISAGLPIRRIRHCAQDLRIWRITLYLRRSILTGALQ